MTVVDAARPEGARIGPLYLYVAREMPDRGLYLVFCEAMNVPRGAVVWWLVQCAGGPFGEHPDDYAGNHSPRAQRLHRDVDAWLLSLGASPGEKVGILA